MNTANRALAGKSTVWLALLGLLVAGCSGAGVANNEDETLAQADQAIVGGEADDSHSAVVAIGDEFGPWCSGTVISRRVVITAAHCLVYPVTRVFFGPNAWQAERFVDVSQTVAHPDYHEKTMANDLALLELAAPAGVPAMPLLRTTMDNSAAFKGAELTFVGYGVTDGVAQNGFGLRRVVDIELIHVGAFIPLDGWLVHESGLYHSDASKNTCFGDSGGPAFLVRRGVEYQVGVTSYGDETCSRSGVSSRTDLPAIDGFIQEVIDSFEQGDPCRADGVCTESCNAAGQLVDPDCTAQHCKADGICAEACVAPGDPDCEKTSPETPEWNESAAVEPKPLAIDDPTPPTEETVSGGGCQLVGPTGSSEDSVKMMLLGLMLAWAAAAGRRR